MASGWTRQSGEPYWYIWTDEVQWSSIANVQAYGQSSLDLVPTALPTVLYREQKHPRIRVDISEMPTDVEWRFWLVVDRTHGPDVRLPPTYDLLVMS